MIRQQHFSLAFAVSKSFASCRVDLQDTRFTRLPGSSMCNAVFRIIRIYDFEFNNTPEMQMNRRVGPNNAGHFDFDDVENLRSINQKDVNIAIT